MNSFFDRNKIIVVYCDYKTAFEAITKSKLKKYYVVDYVLI